MTRPVKVLLGVAGGIAVLLIAVALTGVYIAQSDWLREKLRTAIVAQLEKTTGGRAEIRKFKFDWKTLTAELDDVVLHGTEPAGSPPLLRIKTLVVGFKIISLAKRDVDIATLRIEEPKAYLLVSVDGSTNIPNPKVPVKSDKNAIQTLLDLKVGQFALNRGTVEVHAAGQPPRTAGYDAAGRNLQANLGYEAAGPDYKGTVKVMPLELRYGAYAKVPVNLDLALQIEKSSVRVTGAKLDTAESHAEVSGSLESLENPVVTAQYSGRISVKEAGEILKLKSRQSGTVELGGTARYASPTDYLVTGNIHGRGVTFTQPGLSVRNVRLDSAVEADPKKVKLEGLRLSALGGEVVGAAELREFDAFEVRGKLEHFDVRTLAALETKQKLPYDGVVSGPFEVRGRLSDTRNQHLIASTRLGISPVKGSEPVSGVLDAKYDGARDTVTFGPSFLALPNTRLDLSGVLGQTVKVHAESRNLDDLLPAIASPGMNAMPVSLGSGAAAGSVVFDGAVTGKLNDPRIAGHVTGRNFIYQQQTVDLLDADLTAQSTGAAVSRAMLSYKTLRASFSGSVGLTDWKLENYEPVNARMVLQNANVSELLLLAGQKDIPVTGILSTTAQVTGTVGSPQATADLSMANGSIYQEPFDRLTGNLKYLNGGTQSGTFQLRAGTRQVDLKASYTHAPSDFLTGKLQFDVASNRMMLNQFVNVKKAQPGLNGSVELKASGSVALSQVKLAGSKASTAKVDVGTLNANLGATGLVLDGRPIGDAVLNANTQGQTVKAHLESNFAQSVIRGDGTVGLTGDYPIQAAITFSKVDLGTLRRLLMPAQPGQSMQVGGFVEGRVDVSGPAAKPELLNAALLIPKLEVRPESLTGEAAKLGDLTVRNTEPVKLTLVNQVIRVESAKLTARNTDFAILGQIRLNQKQPLELRATGKVDVSLAQVFDKDLTSSGTVQLNANVRGSFADPQVTGRADLQNVNLAYAGLPNGISNGNGRILFDGSRATIESLTAQTGGGTLRLTGFAAFAGPSPAFRLEANATGVRVRYPEGVSSVSDAVLSLTGTSERSVLAGDITIQKISYNPRSDLGSILSASQPVSSSAAPTGILAGLQFDVRIQTSPDITFETGVAQDLETEANLRLRGSMTNPALLGRVIITQGSLTFFGNKYTINQGTINFFNPIKIEPVLNIDLETKARGVDVTLTVSGPISKLNVTYRSDPPLQFADIVGLLATGKTPSDPTLAARQTDTQQSWQQMGASALVGQAIANPVAGRLQRFLGVSKLKIDPLLPGLGGGGSSAGGASAGARLSVEQQITPNIIFDYVVNTNSTSSQLVRVEWAFSKQWSVVVLREENSAFGIDFQYKKRFK
ncbi:MAG: translocation/assembly module TamB domain-containing protein [Acidobacteriota bacterium]|nr:translocation/assembly module TamB domain-containing protein [Acidobacteriota bacterium]